MNARRRRSATAVLTSAVWRGEAEPVEDDLLALVLHEARRNQVQGLLARAYPGRLSRLLRQVEEETGLFRHNLTVVAGRLRAARVRPVLIKADLAGDYVYTNFDLVVGDRWEAAREALSGWYTSTSGHSLEPDKLLLHPQRGPAAHLHRTVSWFGVPVVAHDGLAAGASEAAAGWLVPGPDDQLRIWLAHAVFQNLALDLSELMAIRKLLAPETVAAAQEKAHREGWRGAFVEALGTARRAVHRLDAGDPLSLPVPLPASASVAVAREHVRHLARTGQLAAARREAMLRAPLAMVKRCRLALA